MVSRPAALEQPPIVLEGSTSIVSSRRKVEETLKAAEERNPECIVPFLTRSSKTSYPR
jgi:hypothetical protein